MKSIPLFITLALAATAHAEVTLPATFSDHMILQAGAAVPVWGWAAPGEEVTVRSPARRSLRKRMRRASGA